MTTSTQTQAQTPSAASIVRKLFGTVRKTANHTIKIADVAVDVLGDAVDLGAKCIQSVPVCIREAAELPTYTRAQLMVNNDESKQLTHEQAIAKVRETAWKGPEDMFKSLGIATGNAISATAKLLNEEQV